MTHALLIEDALAQRGNAVMLIGTPRAGADAVILMVNQPLADLLGEAPERLAGRRLGTLRSLVADDADWSALLACLRELRPLRRDLRLRRDQGELWFGFDLTIGTAPEGGPDHAIVIGRDITQARRRAAQEDESQRLLASVFLRISAAVVIVRPNGVILMANPAFHRLLGYDGAGAAGLNVADLTAPAYAEAAACARERQLADGASYEMRLETIARNGTLVPVRLTSAFLRDTAQQKLRVVTLVPEPPGPERSPALAPPPARPTRTGAARPRAAGQLHVISLGAAAQTFGEAWTRIASRAMLLAEQIIKRRLTEKDVFSRSDACSFAIWFDLKDEDRNAAVLAAAAREIRLRFLSEFSEEIAEQVTSLMVRVENGGDADPGRRGATPAALLERLHDTQRSGALQAKALLAELRKAPIAETRPVLDRDRATRPLVTVDFTPGERRRIAHLACSFAQDPEGVNDLDLLRLDLALRELAGRDEQVLVAISWAAATAPARRRCIDERLARLDPPLRARLLLALHAVPPLASGKRWSEIAASLRQGCGEVALMVTMAEGEPAALQEAVVADWPIALLVLDGAAEGSMPPDCYFGLIAAARRRELDVLVRMASPAQMRDWRELGATLFA